MKSDELAADLSITCVVLSRIPAGAYLSQLKLLARADEQNGGQVIPAPESYAGWHLVLQLIEHVGRQPTPRYCFEVDGARYMVTIKMELRAGTTIEVQQIGGRQRSPVLSWQMGRLTYRPGTVSESVLAGVQAGLQQLAQRLKIM